jgi:hypothetical protein
MASQGLDRLSGVFTYGQALASGLTKHRLYALRDAGIVQSVARGVYERTDLEVVVDANLLEIALRVPCATLCLTSALVRYNLTDENPSAIDVAIPAGSRRPAMSHPVSWHQFNRSTFEIGRSSEEIGHNEHIGIYTPERCIIDSFRLGWLEGEELGYIALRRWLRREGSSPAALLEMARNFPKTVTSLTRAMQTLLYE